MLVTFLRSSWEFFHSFLGDSVFAKLLAGALTLVLPVLFFAEVIRRNAAEPPSQKPRDADGLSGKLYATEMSIARIFRRITGR